jgi:hypothetical protein
VVVRTRAYDEAFYAAVGERPVSRMQAQAEMDELFPD